MFLRLGWCHWPEGENCTCHYVRTAGCQQEERAQPFPGSHDALPGPRPHQVPDLTKHTQYLSTGDVSCTEQAKEEHRVSRPVTKWSLRFKLAVTHSEPHSCCRLRARYGSMKTFNDQRTHAGFLRHVYLQKGSIPTLIQTRATQSVRHRPWTHEQQ
jgi:hypothetical protein